VRYGARGQLRASERTSTKTRRLARRLTARFVVPFASGAAFQEWREIGQLRRLSASFVRRRDMAV